MPEPEPSATAAADATAPLDELPGVRSRERSAFEPVCAALSLAIPLIVTVMRASPFAQWRDDLAVVRGLGLVPIAGEGALSGVAMQAMSLLPIGGRLLRVALVSAIALALASRLVYSLARRTLDLNALTPRLTPPLALAAALVATLAPTWQLEGTIAGGATLAAALALGGVLIRPSAVLGDARVWLGFGALIALTATESHVAGAALLAALAVQASVLFDLPPRRSVLMLALGGVVTAALCLVPLAIRPSAGHAWVDLGFDLSTRGLTALDVAAAREAPLSAWLHEMGPVSLCLAVGGALWGIARPRTRWLIAPLMAFVVADWVFPASRGGVLATDSLAPVRLLAVAAMAVAAALAVHTAALGLQRAQLPAARPASVLLVVFFFTLVFVTSEDSGQLADRRDRHAAEVWTDEALGALPYRSLLLVRSQAVAWRLWASRVVRGERPDLVVVPVPLLSRGSVASRLLQMEPQLAGLIREIAVNGRPSELALSTLADTRPLYVELDPSWDRRLVNHLSPEPLWLGFSAHALGRSDRTAALQRDRAAFGRVLRAANEPGRTDPATLAMLGARAREQTFALAALGDREGVAALLRDLRAIDPAHPFIAEIDRRMGKSDRGRVDVSGLME